MTTNKYALAEATARLFEPTKPRWNTQSKLAHHIDPTIKDTLLEQGGTVWQAVGNWSAGEEL